MAFAFSLSQDLRALRMSPFCPLSVAASEGVILLYVVRLFPVHSQGPRALTSNRPWFAAVLGKANITGAAKFLRAKAGEWQEMNK